jgi:hypothetical protein
MRCWKILQAPDAKLPAVDDFLRVGVVGVLVVLLVVLEFSRTKCACDLFGRESIVPACVSGKACLCLKEVSTDLTLEPGTLNNLHV